MAVSLRHKGWRYDSNTGRLSVYLEGHEFIRLDDNDHLLINVPSDQPTKTVRINSQTYSTAASIIGLQTKPRAGANQTNDVIGMESMPGMGATTLTNTAGIVCFKAEPYIHSTAGAITGDIRCYEANVGKPSGAGTVTGTISCLKCINNANNTVTGGVYCIHVTTGGDTLGWAGFALLPDDSAVAAVSTSTALPACAGWIRVKIGSTFVRLAGYNNS